MHAEKVPTNGPLCLGAVYARTDLHYRFGGTRYKGIVPSTQGPVVLLFHTDEATHQFYGDGFDDDGIYWYSGMGARGDMQWNFENRAIREHGESGKDLLLFERAQREGGLWRYCHQMEYVGHRVIQAPDLDGQMRSAIVFGLLPLESTAAVVHEPADVESSATLLELRSLALAKAPEGVPVVQRVQEVLLRSSAVKRYALMRASGQCEACGAAAPFLKPDGEPFLEVHHLRRLSDGGPDRPDAVAGICPNCHRRCHYGDDGEVFNAKLLAHVEELEAAKN